jgi:hypothetical protein
VPLPASGVVDVVEDRAYDDGVVNESIISLNLLEQAGRALRPPRPWPPSPNWPRSSGLRGAPGAGRAPGVLRNRRPRARRRARCRRGPTCACLPGGAICAASVRAPDRGSLPRHRRANRSHRAGDDTISAHDLLEINADARRVAADLRKELERPIIAPADVHAPQW